MLQIDFPSVVGSEGYIEIKASREGFAENDGFIIMENNNVMCKF
jgi:hypothetical protein